MSEFIELVESILNEKVEDQEDEKMYENGQDKAKAEGEICCPECKGKVEEDADADSDQHPDDCECPDCKDKK
jgi:hypothetical protein